MTVEIPSGWQQLHWKQQMQLAESILAEQGKEEPKLEASKARAIIDYEARRQATEATTPVVSEPVVPATVATVPLRLKRDTWQGETRIAADGRITHWPLDDARRMISEGLAERADPLPGELPAY
jgi:hypothetical protein